MCQNKSTSKMTVRRRVGGDNRSTMEVSSTQQQEQRKRARDELEEEDEDGGGERQSTHKLSHDKLAQMLQHYQNKVRDCKRVIARLKRQKDSELQALVSQLLLLEGHLKREQKEIQGELAERDHLIQAQSQELDKLRRDNRRLINKLKKFSETLEAKESETKERRVKFSRLETDIVTETSHRISKLSDTSSDIEYSNTTNITIVSPASSSDTTLNYSHRCNSQQTVGNSPVKTDSHTNISPRCQSAVAVNTNVKLVRATPDRVLHKPPIAEKPKITARISKMGVHPLSVTPVLSSRRACTIVSTISQLLDEESDGSIATTSSNSEPSSPEATLKPVTPRVIRLARHFEEGLSQQSDESQHCGEHLTKSNVAALHSYHGSPPSDSSFESQRHQDYQYKSYTSDEHEVTSGYNSDAVSEHDYENICIGGRRVTEDVQSVDSKDSASINTDGQQDTEDQEDGYVVFSDTHQDFDDDNYVVFRELKRNDINQDHIDDDQNIYSNVEFASGFASGLMVRPLSREEESASEMGNESPMSSTPRQESNSIYCSTDSLCSSNDNLLSENVRAIRNVPRSRHNINIIFENDGDHMTENFEEFSLDSLEFDDDPNSNIESSETSPQHCRGKENFPIPEPRKRGDGAESRLERQAEKSLCDPSKDSSNQKEVLYLNANGQYEKFLEVTGLSQKSILTPMRMLINHRSVVKPRDIKHRNKLRTAFTTLSTLEEAPAQEYKYWSGPYI